MKNKQTVFSGLQPTGNLTLGNYLGAISNWVKMQDDYSCIYCLVDLHAMTAHYDPQILKQNVLTNLAVYLACGLDPNKSIIFNQSMVKEHTELSWIFGCLTPIGWLNRMTQFKEKAGGEQEKAALGLYSYPVLMAADILLYHATLVPVGDDQTQHLELARDIAGAFNRKYKTDLFLEPKAITHGVATRIMSLQDGTKKMSKSDPSDLSRINIIDSPELIEKKINKAKTDAIMGISYDKERRPEITNLVNIYSALSELTPQQVVDQFSSASNASFKKELVELVVEKLNPIRLETEKLLGYETYLRGVLKEGGQRASSIADNTMQEVRHFVGL